MGDGNRVAIGIAIRIVMVIGMWGGGDMQAKSAKHIHTLTQPTNLLHGCFVCICVTCKKFSLFFCFVFFGVWSI